MSLLSAPFEAVYNKDLYRKAAQSSAAHGFLYLLYFSVLITVLAMLVISVTIVPEGNRFMAWIKMNMPVVEIVRGEGIKINASSPYEMIHPEYGKVAIFDMTKTEVSLEEIGDWKVFVTSTKGYFQRDNGQLQVYDLKGTRRAEEKAGVDDRVVDAAFVQKIENIVKPVLLVLILGIIFVFFFIWKLIAALFYSLIGISLNRMRRERLSYGQILNVSFLAITPAAWVQFLLLLRGLEIPFGFLWSLAITSAYLYFGIKKAEEDFPPSV